MRPLPSKKGCTCNSRVSETTAISVVGQGCRIMARMTSTSASSRGAGEPTYEDIAGCDACIQTGPVRKPALGLPRISALRSTSSRRWIFLDWNALAAALARPAKRSSPPPEE